jgi:hypothetical protein
MKKLLCALLILTLLVPTAGCGTPAETTAPETVEPETTVPETTAPETTEPETTVPETTVPETTVPETTVPETTAPETTEPETTAPETTADPDAIVLSPDMQAKMKKYMPAAWLAKLPGIAPNISDKGTFAFAVQTDTHYTIDSTYQQTMRCLKAITHYLPLDFIANTGDLIKGYQAVEENTPEKSIASMRELLNRYTEDVNCPVLLTFGNHDTNQIWSKEHGAATDQLTRADHYEMVTSKLKEVNNDKLIGVGEGAMVTDGESNYYYVDFHHDRIRVIMLNSTDGNYSTEFASLSTISNEQAEWFRNEALYTNYSVIVMIHIPLLKYFPGNESWSVVNSHKITLAVNEFVAAGGDFIAYMYGHTHTQSHLVDRDGRLHVSFKSGANRAELVTVDTDARRIITYGLGEVEDREFDY